MTEHTVAFWNLENLFDVQNSPHRPEWLQRTLRRELDGWTEAVLEAKIAQLARIIAQMNNGLGPDVLGMCEIENKPVVERLMHALSALGRNYAVVHHDGNDDRGIDVAFLFDADRFEATATFHHVILKRSSTRDIFQVNLRSTSGKELIVIGNHWPARSGGVWESEPYRMTAGETLAYWMTRIQEIKGSDAAVIAMGDFNDQPFDRSLQTYALATNCPKRVQSSISPRLLNLMWKFYGQAIGTYYFDNFPLIFDQFLASKGLVSGRSGLMVSLDSVEILMPPEMVSPGTYPVPKRHGRPSSGFEPEGFSDHYPITVRVQEADII